MSLSPQATMRPHLGPVLILIVATLAVFAQVWDHTFINNWDDGLYVAQNPAVHALSWTNIRTVFSTFYVGNYAPVQMLSYMLDYAVWGDRAGGFLLTNLLIHLANGLLFYALLWRVKLERWTAFLGAALFLLHPVQVESVAWVSQRKNLLAMLFVLIAWHFYCRYREAERGSMLAYTAALIAFVLALLSKSVAVIFPVIIFLFDICFHGRRPSQSLKDKLPFILAAAAVGWLALLSQQGGGRAGYHGGSALATFYTMLPVLCQYLRMIVWPSRLSAEYNPLIHQHLDLVVVGAMVIVVLAVGATAWLWVRHRRLAFWALLFFIGLLPVSQIVPIVTLINDRYLYFPMLGTAALSASAYGCLASRMPAKRLLALLPGALLIALAVVSWRRVDVWRDDYTLWSDAAAKYPGKATIQSAMGDVLINRGMRDEAYIRYQQALRLDPNEANALLNLGVLYSQKGDLANGERLLSRAAAMEPNNFKAWADLGNNYMLQRDYVEAEKAYRRAFELQPAEPKLLTLLGDVALLRHDLSQARALYLEAEQKGSQDSENACALARVEASAGHGADALNWLETAFRRGLDEPERLKDYKELETLLRSPAYREMLGRHFPQGAQRR